MDKREIEHFGLKISNFKCFGSTAAGYERIRPINLIIGRNNSGKSTLLDLLDYICAPKDLGHLQHKGQPPVVPLEYPVSEKDMIAAFPPNRSGGDLGNNHFDYGRLFVGRRIKSHIGINGIGFDSMIDQTEPLKQIDSWHQVAQHIVGNPFKEYSFKRLLADRDLVPETDQNSLDVSSNGVGGTNALQRFINLTTLPRELVEYTLLNDLNSIFEPDGYFTDITTRRNPSNNTWEVFLQEAAKGLIPLTHSGSGVKTVLLVLIFLHLVPHHEKKQLSQYLFGFEELENNLHPALQRRLLLYLRKKAEAQNCHFFLTTHSNICIDLFAHDKSAQILHITHNKSAASAKTVVTYVDNKGILDDLDLRASDLLQANGLVWLEGPSDRLYFNRWIELWSDDTLREGAHYQCVFYGGRLLAHLSASDPDVNTQDVVRLLRVNRNAILLVDSDRRSETNGINATKQRLVSEVEAFGGMAWVTYGKEIENYLPVGTLQRVFRQTKVNPLQRFEDFAEYLNSIEKDQGHKFLRKKVLFAESLLPHITKEALRSTFDLEAKLDKAVQTIRSWSGLGDANG